jgi:NhaP-type Na+/H+ or K+/H+ antiporter
LTVILIKAGLGLDAPALLKLSLIVIRLALLPCIMEAVAAAVISYYILGYPWLWGLMLGYA